MDGLRRVLTVAKSEDDPRVRTLHVEKSNLAADDLPDIRYCIRGDWPETGIAWQVQDAAGPAQQRILTTISAASGPLGLRDIAKRSGVPYDSARVLIGRLVRQGLLSRAGWGTYATAGTAQSGGLSAIAPEPTRADTPPGKAGSA